MHVLFPICCLFCRWEVKQPTAAAHIPALSLPTLMKARNTLSKLMWSPSSTAKFLLARFYNRNGGINFLRKLLRFFMYQSMPGTYITHWNLLSTPRLMYYYDLYYVSPPQLCWQANKHLNIFTREIPVKT